MTLTTKERWVLRVKVYTTIFFNADIHIHLNRKE